MFIHCFLFSKTHYHISFPPKNSLHHQTERLLIRNRFNLMQVPLPGGFLMAQFGNIVSREGLHLRTDNVDYRKFPIREATHIGLGGRRQDEAFLIVDQFALRHYLVKCAVYPVPSLRHGAKVYGIIGQPRDSHAVFTVG